MLYRLKTPPQRQKALEALREAPEDHVCVIREHTRSLDQNALLWRLLTVLSRTLPWTVNGTQTMLTPEDWKDICTASLYQENRIARGIRGGFVMLGRSTSKMSVTQMVELIEFIYAFGAEQGVDFG